MERLRFLAAAPALSLCLAAGLGFLVGGCSSHSSRRVQLQAVPTPGNVRAPQPEPTTTAPPASRQELTRAPQQEPEWLSLAEWAQDRLGAALERVTDATNLCFDLVAPRGRWRLSHGSALARFNDVGYWLGYAPQAANQKLYIHRIDAEKNLSALLSPGPATRNVPPTIVLDPGHGGLSLGTRAADGSPEKNYTLDWALRLVPLLEGIGWRVVLTRTNDVDISLPRRVEIAEEANADLFVSLHFNSSFPRTDQEGIETYCLTPTGLPSTLTRNYEDDFGESLPNNSYDTDNLLYAFRLHGVLLKRTGASDRGIRRARFMGVLRNQKRPAILLEAGYLSHEQEAARIASPEYRQLLAEAVAEALQGLVPSVVQSTPIRP